MGQLIIIAPENCLFPHGQIVATRGAMEVSEGRPLFLSECLTRHLMGDWGNVCKEDAAANNAALKDGDRIFSVYVIDESKPCEGDNRIWVITEWDRSVTTFLLPSEY